MKTCFLLLKNVLLDAFDVSAFYFTPPYEDFSKIDLGIRAAVWNNYNDEKSKLQFLESTNNNRIIIIRSNLGFYNLMIFWKNTETLDFISVGPFRNDELSPNYFTQILKEAQLSPEVLQKMKYIYENMPLVQLDTLVNVCIHILSSRFPEFSDITPELLEYADQERPVDVHTDIIEQNFSEFATRYANSLSEFLKYLKCGDNPRAKKSLQAFLHETHSTTKRTLRSYKSFLFSLNNYCHMALLETSIHPSHTLKLASTLGLRIENATSLAKLEQMLNDLCHKYCLLVKNYAHPDYSKLTKDVIAYIMAHLDEDLSLNQVAEHFRRNPSALSTAFSKETGQTLTSFIQQSRINEAIRLFNTTDMTVSEVAFAVGYQDFSYFSKIFSKQVGCSPRAYKMKR